MDGKHFSVVLYLFMVSDETVHFTLSDFKVYTRNNDRLFLSDEGPMLETLDYTICIGSTSTFYISICICILPTQHIYVYCRSKAFFVFPPNYNAIQQSTSLSVQILWKKLSRKKQTTCLKIRKTHTL